MQYSTSAGNKSRYTFFTKQLFFRKKKKLKAWWQTASWFI